MALRIHGLGGRVAENAEFGRRLREAKRSWEQRHDRDLTWREIGEAVGERLGREPYAPTVVHRWFNKGTEPAEFAVTHAIAEILEVDPGKLAFGEAPAAMPPVRRVAEPTPTPPSPAPKRTAALDEPIPEPRRDPAAKKKRA